MTLSQNPPYLKFKFYFRELRVAKIRGILKHALTK
jgi:hypothetical protein